MDLRLLMNFLMVFPACISSAITLTESGGGLKKPGDTLQLTCRVSGFSITTYGIHWIRQAPGKGLEWNGIIWSAGTTNYNSALQNRIRITRDTSNSQVFLELNALKTEDTAIYYCASVWLGAFSIWGQGTTVTVTSATSTAPTVFPLSPCGQDVSTVSKVSMGCLIKNYFPEPATVQWNSGAITSGIQDFPSVLHSSGRYTHSNLLTVPVSQWESGTFQCNVGHTATNSRINKNIQRRAANKPVAPEVRLLHSSCSPKVSVGKIELMCLISGFYPKELKVEWLVGSQQGLLVPYTEPPRQDAGRHTFSTTSTVNVTQADWLEGNTYYCQVTHAATHTKVKSRAKKCEDGSSCSSSTVNVYTLPPTPRALYTDRNSKVSCVVGNLENDQGLKITWNREKSGVMNPDPLQSTEEQNGTYTVVSRLPIFPHEWESGETFTCSVEYPGLVVPITKTIFKSTGKTSAPIVSIFPPPQEELNPGNHLSLSCMINGFSPRAFDFQWLKNHSPMPENSYVNTPAMKNKHEDSYFAYSKVTISKAEWDQRNTFTCMVVHEALPMKFTQRNISKTQGKK